MGTWMRCWILCFCISAVQTTVSFLRFQSPGLVLVSVGGTVELECSFEQKVQYCHSTTWHKLNLRTGEITPSINSEAMYPKYDGKTCTLKLNDLTCKDSGLYICISHYNSMHVVGNGSRVIVTTDVSVPELSVLYSPPEAGSPSVQLQCLVLGAVTSQVQVFWMIGKKKYSGWTEPAWTNEADSATEFTRAHLSISTEEWNEEEEIQCSVEYKGQHFSKILRRYVLNPRTYWLLYCSCGSVFLCGALVFCVSLYQGKPGAVTEDLSSVIFYPVDPFRIKGCQQRSENVKEHK